MHVWANPPDGGPFSSAIVKPVNTHLSRIAHDYTFTPTVLNHLSVYFNRVTNSIHNLHEGQPDPLTIPGTSNTSVPGSIGAAATATAYHLGQDKASDSVLSSPTVTRTRLVG